MLPVATCAQGPVCMMSGKPFPWRAHPASPPSMLTGRHSSCCLGDRWRGKLLLPESKPRKAVQKFPWVFHQAQIGMLHKEYIAFLVFGWLSFTNMQGNTKGS